MSVSVCAAVSLTIIFLAFYFLQLKSWCFWPLVDTSTLCCSKFPLDSWPCYSPRNRTGGDFFQNLQQLCLQEDPSAVCRELTSTCIWRQQPSATAKTKLSFHTTWNRNLSRKFLRCLIPSLTAYRSPALSQVRYEPSSPSLLWPHRPQPYMTFLSMQYDSEEFFLQHGR